MPNIFPHGLKSLHQKLNLPFAAHNRYWSRNATYAKQNGGKYNFIMGKMISLPDDQSFWDDFMADAKKWGLVMYEQDWLDAQLLGMEALQNNLSLGQRWLEQMGTGSDKSGIPIQYSMALPRHALQSLTIPTVTQARVSDDYHLTHDQWKIGITSIFANSLGLSPSKDTFWTTTVQPGNPNEKDCHRNRTAGDVSKCGHAREPYPVLETLVAVLSTGPVGPGDMINGTDREILMRCCDEDGLILKPSKPATAIDDQIIQAALQDGSGPDGEVWTTYTDFDDVNLRFGIILAANTTDSYTITRKGAGLIPYVDMYPNKIFEANDTSSMHDFDDQQPFTIPACSLDDVPSGCLYYTSPVLTIRSTDVVILGDLDKYVPMSPQRVYKIWVTDDTVALTLRGKPEEVITASFAVNDTLLNTTESVNASGCANFILYQETGSSFSFPKVLDCSYQMTTTAAPPTPPTTTSTKRTSKVSTSTHATTKHTTRKMTSTTKKSSNSSRNTCMFSLIIFMVILRFV